MSLLDNLNKDDKKLCESNNHHWQEYLLPLAYLTGFIFLNRYGHSFFIFFWVNRIERAEADLVLRLTQLFSLVRVSCFDLLSEHTPSFTHI